MDTENTEEVKKEEVKAEPSEAKHSDEEIKIALEKAKRFDMVQERVKTDEHFREVFDGAWRGKVYKEFEKEVQKQMDTSDDPYTNLKTELSQAKNKEQEIAERLEKLEGAYVKDKTDQFKSQIGGKYESEFRALAEQVGYEPGSPAYEVLYDNVKDKTYNIASQKGMDDFLVNYRAGLIKESFNKAFDAHKKAGFDEAWNTRKKIMEAQKKKENAPKDDKQLFFEKYKDKMVGNRDNIKKYADMYFRQHFNPDA